ncbi:MAG: DDE-type integrase/transposase/recombinase [Caldilineaceae bacterium]
MQWRQAQRTAEAETIVAAVQTIRHRHRRMGTRKLWKELPNTLAEQGIHIGRDRLFALLRQRNLLVPRVRRPHRTTWAGLWRCDNLLAAKVVTAPNQAWVSDITYILTDVGFRYLVLITDVFSRRIMGFDLSDSLTVDGLTRALDMALAQVPGRQTVSSFTVIMAPNTPVMPFGSSLLTITSAPVWARLAMPMTTHLQNGSMAS